MMKMLPWFASLDLHVVLPTRDVCRFDYFRSFTSCWKPLGDHFHDSLKAPWWPFSKQFGSKKINKILPRKKLLPYPFSWYSGFSAARRRTKILQRGSLQRWGGGGQGVQRPWVPGCPTGHCIEPGWWTSEVIGFGIQHVNDIAPTCKSSWKFFI